jgi:hypothetical protein
LDIPRVHCKLLRDLVEWGALSLTALCRYRERSPSPVVKEEESDALPSTESGRTDPQSLSLPTSLPLRLVTWTSPDCREARRFEVFKRVDSLQPCAEADTGTDNKNNSTAKPSFGAATPQASTKSPGPGDDLEEIRRRNVRSNPSPRDGLAGPYTKAKSSIPDPRPRLPKKESVDSICETSIAKSLHESSLPDWSASQCDSPESGPSSSGNHDIKQPNAHGDKHKARRNRKIEKRQRRNNEDDDRPTSFPVAAGWDRDEKAGIPCIYGEFHPSKYDSDQCRITKYEEFSHLLYVVDRDMPWNTNNNNYRKHLKQPIHHNLYDCKEYISNVHPRPPPSTPVPSIQSLPPPASSSNTPCPVDNAQNAIPPAGTRPISEVLFVALCKLCWIEFHDQESLDAHKNAGCRKYDPGKLRKWQAMYNAFCVKLFQRRFPSIPLSQETGLLHATPRAAASHNDSPRHDYAHATDQDRSHYACVSQSAFHAIVGELFQKIDDLSCRLSSEALSEHSTFRPHTGTVEERNRVLQGMARVGDEVSTSFGFVGMHSVTMDIPPANRPGGSGIAFAPSTDLAIDPGVKPPTSPRDSGIGSFVSQSGSLRAQNNSSESQNGVSESLAETSESRSEMLTSQQNIASETTERTVDIRPYLDPDHSNYCACDGCIAFHVYRGNRNLPSGGPQVQSATGNDVSFSDYFIEQSEY